MIINLLSWIYVSLVCLVWGNLFVSRILKNISFPSPQIELSLICLTGLSFISFLSFALSIFLPLDWKIHLGILLPVVAYCVSPNRRMILQSQIAEAFKNFSIAGYCLWGAGMLMILTIGSQQITHPDTLAYHAQSIQWFEKYRAIPGIAHLRLELGLQSSWFAAEAFFKPLGAPYFMLGGCVMSWYLLFVVKKIDQTWFSKINSINGTNALSLGWIGLLLYTLLSWTQVRLTAASASPDFIVALYILAAAYLFYQGSSIRENRFYFVLAVLFSSMAVTIKLSSAAIIGLPILCAAYFFYHRQFKSVWQITLIGAILILPLIARNLIASGYPFYPSSTGDWFNPDWKLKSGELLAFRHYITGYARFPVTVPEAEKYRTLGVPEWAPHWWKHLAIADQLLLCVIPLLLFPGLFFCRSFIKKMNWKQGATFLVALAGCLVWFFAAPDPRFGTGFLIVFIYCLSLPLNSNLLLLNRIRLWVLVCQAIVWCTVLTLVTYTGYRMITYSKPSQILYPSGIQHSPHDSVNREQMTINFVEQSVGCGITPVPCVDDSSRNFIPRGKTVVEGFRRR